MKPNIQYYKGDIYYADLSPVVGCEQGGIRPVLIIQNDLDNKYEQTVIVAIISDLEKRLEHPTHYKLNLRNCTVLLNQLRTIDKQRLREKIDTLEDEEMKEINKILQSSFDFE